MQDYSRPLLLAAIAVLFLVLTSMGPGLFFGISLSGAARWFLIGLLIWFVVSRNGGCCGGRCCCCWGDCTCDTDEEEEA
ncbi:MAG: hypothetical protein HKN29_09500 [Rhodothermales bacterium]|nr:hypothetical protein [Rhodothermales bacterium]